MAELEIIGGFLERDKPEVYMLLLFCIGSKEKGNCITLNLVLY